MSMIGKAAHKNNRRLPWQGQRKLPASRQERQAASSKKAAPTGGDDVADLHWQAQVQPVLSCVVPTLQQRREGTHTGRYLVYGRAEWRTGACRQRSVPLSGHGRCG